MKPQSTLKALLALSFIVLLSSNLTAQESIATPHDTLAQNVMRIQSDVEALKKIKFSAYVQSQFQWADSNGIRSVAGGDFPSNTDKRFKVRRAEFKTMYDNGVTQVVANIDVTQNGINIKDAFGKFTEQHFKRFALTAGIFNRPFGFEVPYSSGLLETPERSRVIQTLFPGERDLGAMITFQMPNNSPLHPLKVEAGMFNGTGNNINDYDYKKDFIGNIHWNQTLSNEKVSFGIGISYYNGGSARATKYAYSMGTLASGKNGFLVDSAKSNVNSIAKREYIGMDAQVNVDFPFGISTFRAEYIQGTQPGTAGSSVSIASAPTDVYVRNFNGGYLIFVQNIMKTKHAVIVKYDFYDPNTKVQVSEIGGTGSKLSGTDLRYTTYGFGWSYRLDANVKFTFYYDKVRNESSQILPGWSHDLKDNVLTLRCQYKF